MEQWYSETVPVITFPDPDVATWYLHEFDEHMAAKGAPEEAWLLSPPCGHSDCLATWHTAGRLTLWCARCHARVLVAVQWGVVLQHEDEAEEATTICGHAPYAKVVYRAGYVRVYCGECQTRWSRWAVAPYVHEVPM